MLARFLIVFFAGALICVCLDVIEWVSTLIARRCFTGRWREVKSEQRSR
jgi:hypothetical protein